MRGRSMLKRFILRLRIRNEVSKQRKALPMCNFQSVSAHVKLRRFLELLLPFPVMPAPCFSFLIKLLTGGVLLTAAILRGASDVHVVTQVPPTEAAGGSFGGGNPDVFTPSADKAYALLSSIQTALNAGRAVTLNTASDKAGNGDLFLKTGITKVSGASSTLTFNAERHLVVEGYIYSSQGNLPLVFNAGSDMSNNQVLNSSGGNLTVNVGQMFNMGAGITAGSGTLLVQRGILSALNPVSLSGASVQFSAASALRIPGSVEGNLIMAGSLSPGAPQATRKLEVKGTLTLLGTATSLFELSSPVAAGSSYDFLKVTGAASLAGTLELDLVQDYQFRVQATDRFVVLEAASLSGTFANLPHGSRVSLSGNKGSFRVTYTSTQVILDAWQPPVTALTWDPGTAPAGTQVHTQTLAPAGRYYFRIQPQAVPTGAWRTRLTVSQGTTALYLARGYYPSSSIYDYVSAQSGNTGLLLHEGLFAPGEEWYAMVECSESATWQIFSGAVYVSNLGTLPFTDGNDNSRYDLGELAGTQTSGVAVIPPEGLLFYQATVPAGSPAWRLYLNGSSHEISIREGKVPVPTAPPLFLRKQQGQMLVTAPELAGEEKVFYLAVAGTPGTSFTLDSGIQAVADLAFNGGTATLSVTGVPYRCYRVQVPSDQTAWDISTIVTSGNPNIAVSKEHVPGEWHNDAFSEAPGDAEDSITLVPDVLTEGTWYVTVYSTSSYACQLASTAAATRPLSFTDTQTNTRPNRAGGCFYALTDLAAQQGQRLWELRLQGQSADTQIALRRGKLPGRWQFRSSGNASHYDTENLHMDAASASGVLQNVGHEPDAWYVGVFRLADKLGSFQLKTGPAQPAILNFDSSQNSNGATHTSTRTLATGERAYYSFTIPSVLDGQPLLGWLMNVTTTQGSARLRFYPAGEGGELTAIEPAGPSALVVPPYLTPGVWTVEVSALGPTTFNLTSQSVKLARTPWTMPAAASGQFGDSGVTNLPVNGWHVYAVDVPAGNAGLFRTELQSLTGNADLLIREDGVPSPDHDADGGLEAALPLVDRQLSGVGTEYGNWVPVNGRYQSQLRPGRWYMAVRNKGAQAAQYRLLLGSGQVTSLPLNGGSLTNQMLAAGDWRYYRFTLPLDAPSNWHLTFAETSGDVVMWLRDTVPPGNNRLGMEVTDQGGGLSGLCSWYADSKNQGPYSGSGQDTPGTYTFSTPPLRPGHTYYVGFQARTAATFSIQSSTSGPGLGTLPVLDYYVGTQTVTLPPAAERIYLLAAPADATRMMWQATHPATVQLRLEQGTLPGQAGPQHWTSGAQANVRFNQRLNGQWPWLPGSTYYLRAINTGTDPASLTLNMDGRNAANADEDLDVLPDAWEKQYYANEHDATTTTDTDNDGVPNLAEYAFNLSPVLGGTPVLAPGMGLAGLPSITYSGGRLRVEHIRRRTNRHLRYMVEFSDDLVSARWNAATAAPVISPINTEWERVVVEDADGPTSGAARFGRVRLQVIAP